MLIICVIIFFKVAELELIMNTELVDKPWTIASRGNRRVGSHEPPLTAFSSIDKYVTVLLCFYQKTIYFTYTIDTWTSNSQTIALTQAEWNLPNTGFLFKTCHSTTTGSHIKQKNHKNTKMWKKYGAN